MNALSPFWAAVAVFSAVAAVIALYLLKPPPRRLLVPSSLIWERVLKHSHRTRDRLRWWLSLLLAVLIAVCIAVALTRPQLTAGGRSAAELVLVIDNSPTMATRTTDGSSRWEQAFGRARALLESKSAGTQVLLADTMRHIATPAFESRDAALERLTQLRVSQGGVPRISGSVLRAGVETVVISDGVSLSGLPKSARLESVFEPVENVGLTAFDVRPLPVDPSRYQAFVEVTNAGSAEKQVEVAIAGVGGHRVAKTLRVPAAASRAEMLDISSFEGGPVRASVAMPGDGLAADDVAYALLPMRRVVRVALISNGNSYLEKSLRAQPRVRLTLIAPQNYAGDRDYDAYVFDRFAPKTRPAAPALLFGPGSADWLPAVRGEMADLNTASWNRAHPLLENLSLADLHIDRALVPRPRATAGETVLARTRNDVPLIVAQEGAARWVSVAFGLEDSNFALHAAFPVFLNNALNWMVAEPPALAADLGVIEVPLANARVIAADGNELPTRAVPGGSVFEVNEPGFFTAVSANQRLRIAANLLDRSVTEVNRSQLPAVKPEAIESAATARTLSFDPWAALLLAAALLLGFEWWSWNRRLTV